MDALGYRFTDPELLACALTHRSMGAVNNERLEFLGDALLNTIVAIELFSRCPDAAEGDLSRLRAWLVRGDTLAEVGRALHLGEALRLGEGERKSGGARRGSIVADGLEAVIGAVYLDGGFNAAQRLVLRLLADRLDNLPAFHDLKDPKTRLQEYLQARQYGLPKYDLVESKGADHAREFTVRCRVGELALEATATASSRRRAEQGAAEACIARLQAGASAHD